ncbi:MAG: hypothetical protein LBJ81_02090 [Puniceicoccales bacterium]|nr:hypothetical protein [Puniceicoccales bacterium]
MKKYYFRHSFSLVEAVFVLAIVGILLSLSLRSISRLAENFAARIVFLCEKFGYKS